MAAIELESLLNRLADIPPRLANLITGLDESTLRKAPSPDGWSAATILAHLRASDDILSHRLYAILVRDNPPMPAFDERRWAEIAGYERADVRASLHLFSLQRAELVHMLRQVELDDWQRTTVHEVNGTITLLAAVTHLIKHEEEHCLQLEINPAADSEKRPQALKNLSR